MTRRLRVNPMPAAIELPDDHVFTDAEREAVEDLVWTGYFLNHRDPGPEVWALHQLIAAEPRVKTRGGKPTIGQIRALLRRDEEERHAGFYRCAGEDVLYDAEAYEGHGQLVSASSLRESEPKRFALLVRRRDYFAESGKLPNF